MIVIGKIKELYPQENVPSIKELIGEAQIKDKEKVLRHLKESDKISFASGKATDLVSGNEIDGELCCYSDGTYAWRSDTVYYFEKYNTKLPNEFIEHVLNQK